MDVRPVSQFVFPENGRTELADALGLDSATEIRTAANELRAVARQYLTWKAQRLQEPTRAVARAQLHEIEAAGQKLVGRLVRLQGDARWELGRDLAYRNESGLPWAVGLTKIQNDIHDLSSSARNVREILSKGSDKQPLGELGWAIDQLVAIYDKFSGRRVTHTRSADDGSPTSHFGKFVIAFFRLVDRDITPSRISTELEKIKKRTRKPRARKTISQTQNRGDRLV